MGGDSQKMLKWQKVSTGIPSGRFGHSCIVIGDSLVLFGGINDHGIRQNDTWVGQIERYGTQNIRFSWRRVDVGPIVPPPRGAHAGCCVDSNRMVINGGIGLDGLRLRDTWILDLSEDHCFGMWHEIVTNPAPPARSGHTMTCIGGTQTVLFGGRGMGYEVLNDLWVFDVSGSCLEWLQVLYELRNVPEVVSLPRVGHSATPLLGGRVLIYGGEDSYRHRKDDFWVLDLSRIPSVKSQSHPSININTNRNSQMWKRLKAEGYKPESRSFHRACADRSGRYLYVFGGMVDGLLHPAESSGLRFNGELFLVDLQLQL